MPLYATYNDGVDAYFDYRPTLYGDVIRVMWTAGSGIAIIPAAVALTFVRLGYGRNLTSDEVAEYNNAVAAYMDAFNAETGSNVGDPTPAAVLDTEQEPAAEITPPPAPEGKAVGAADGTKATTAPEIKPGEPAATPVATSPAEKPSSTKVAEPVSVAQAVKGK